MDEWQGVGSAPICVPIQLWLKSSFNPTGWWEPNCRLNDGHELEFWDANRSIWYKDTSGITVMYWMHQPLAPKYVGG